MRDKGGLCAACLSPGACCREVVLSGGRDGDYLQDPELTEEQAVKMAALYELPFIPLRKGEHGSWIWRCPELDEATGRCKIYETRPQLCRDYKEGSDPLCVHHWTGEEDGSSGDAGAPGVPAES